MCEECGKAPPLSYARIYQEVFCTTRERRDAWLQDMMRKSQFLCLRHERDMLRYLTIALETQGCLCMTPSVRCDELRWRVNAAQRKRTMRCRRLLFRMLRFTYRPADGRMFRRVRNEFVDGMRSIDAA